MLVRRLFIVLVFLMAVPAMAQDDDNLQVQFLRDGDAFTYVFEGDITAHLFAFNATAGDMLELTMESTEKPTTAEEIPNFLDPYLVLLGPRGEFLASDDDSGDALDAVISGYTIPADGSYFVLATSFQHLNNILVEAGEADSTLDENTIFEYTIQANGINPPTHLDNYRDDTAQFFRGDINIGGRPIRGASTIAEPVFYFGLPGQVGQTITITLESDEFDTALHLFSPSGVRVAVNDDDLQGTGTDSAIRGYTLQENGLYLIFATDIFFYRAGQKLNDDQIPFEGGEFILEVNSTE